MSKSVLGFMKKLFGLFFLIFLVGLLSCKAKNPVVGTWKEFRVEWKDTSFHLPIEQVMIGIKFSSNNTMIDEWNGRLTNMSYKIQHDTIFVEGEPTYLIVDVTKDNLVLLDYNEDENCLCRRHFFKRSKSLEENYCCDKSVNNEQLMGFWREYKTEWKDTSMGKCNHEPILGLRFKKNHQMVDEFNGTQTPMSYRIENDTIIIETKPRYLIEKITEDELVLTDYILNSFGKLTSTLQRHYFKKVEGFEKH